MSTPDETRLILTFHVEDVLPALKKNVPTGLYIVQSRDEPCCFRAGAGGVHGETSTLVNRLKQHMSKPPGRNDINWTEFHRNWVLRWAVQFPGCNRLTGRLCEAVLIAKLAQQYHFIPEGTGSGFFVPTDEINKVITFARAMETEFLPVLEQQVSRPKMRFWQKGTKEGLPSRYLD